MNGSEIVQSNQEKDLGIIIDNKLIFQEHINSQTKNSKSEIMYDQKIIYIHV